MNISIIVAIARNHGIGFENKLLYWLPNDLKRFKALTTGHTIIMGRKTFESLPKGALPNRQKAEGIFKHQVPPPVPSPGGRRPPGVWRLKIPAPMPWTEWPSGGIPGSGIHRRHGPGPCP